MKYVDGFVVAVPAGNKEKYRAAVAVSATVFREFGALRVAECWADDVPRGEVTDFYRAVKANDDEAVVFSWVEWPSKEVRDVGMKKAMEDPRLAEVMGKDTFDGKRMIYGGFITIVDQ